MSKRLCSSAVNDVIDGRKIKKKQVSIETAPISNAKEADQLEDALPAEYQPQFRNYMLIGDLIAIMILHSKSLINKTKSSQPVLYQHFCHSTWSIGDLLNELKSKKSFYKIAKNVILSVGYNDYCNNSINAALLVEGIEKVISKLRKRGCEDIILTNIPPAAAKSSSLDHWKYLYIANLGISRLCEKYEYVGACNIFKLFGMPKNYFNKNKEYVTFGEITYKVDSALYNEHRKDMISFSTLGKTVLGKHIASSIENRLEYLRRKEKDKPICTIELSDSEDVEVVTVKKGDPDDVVIDLDADEDNKNSIKQEVDGQKVLAVKDEKHPMNLFCSCKDCTLFYKTLMLQELEENLEDES